VNNDDSMDLEGETVPAMWESLEKVVKILQK